MLTELKARHAELARSYEQQIANINATNGAKLEIERLIAQMEQEASSARAATLTDFTPRPKRGPKPGAKRRVAVDVPTEFVNDVVREEDGGA